MILFSQAFNQCETKKFFTKKENIMFTGKNVRNFLEGMGKRLKYIMEWMVKDSLHEENEEKQENEGLHESTTSFVSKSLLGKGFIKKEGKASSFLILCIQKKMKSIKSKKRNYFKPEPPAAAAAALVFFLCNTKVSKYSNS